MSELNRGASDSERELFEKWMHFYMQWRAGRGRGVYIPTYKRKGERAGEREREGRKREREREREKERKKEREREKRA